MFKYLEYHTNRKSIALNNKCGFKDNSNQTKKITEEKYEFFKEVIRYKYKDEFKENENIKEKMGLEAFDLIQATYTFLCNNFTENEIRELNLKHLKKLEDRQKILSNQEDTINLKDLAYDFLKLSYVTRFNILNELNLINENEYDIQHAELIEKIIERSKENKSLNLFKDKIEEKLK